MKMFKLNTTSASTVWCALEASTTRNTRCACVAGLGSTQTRAQGLWPVLRSPHPLQGFLLYYHTTESNESAFHGRRVQGAYMYLLDAFVSPTPCQSTHTRDIGEGQVLYPRGCQFNSLFSPRFLTRSHHRTIP